jgi:hypothetical protein
MIYIAKNAKDLEYRTSKEYTVMKIIEGCIDTRYHWSVQYKYIMKYFYTFIDGEELAYLNTGKIILSGLLI